MGQKTAAPGLRQRLNRGYDLGWFQEAKFYSKTLLKDYQYREYLQGICSQLPKTFYSGRIFSEALPKKYSYNLFYFLNYKKKDKKKVQNTQTGEAKKNPLLPLQESFQNVLKVNYRQHQFGQGLVQFQSESKLLKPHAPKNTKTLNALRLIGDKWAGCSTNVSLVRTPRVTSSAAFFNEIIIRSLQSRKGGPGFRKAIQMCLKAAKSTKTIQGIRITCAGRFNGVDRARLETKSWGNTSLQRFAGHLDYSAKPAQTNTGVFGIKVWVLYNS